MVTEAKSARRWLALLVLGTLALEVLGGATATMAPLAHPAESSQTSDPNEPTAPASLQARVLELEAASEALAAKLARARRELSEL